MFILSVVFQHNGINKGMDINVTCVWERNITGQGVTVVVVDDGVEHTLKDIQPNYVSFNYKSLNSVNSSFWTLPIPCTATRCRAKST